MFRKTFDSIREWLLRILNGRSQTYRTIYMEELPDRIEAYVIYVLGEGNHRWSAAMLCPCGCGETLQLSLHKDGRPRWDIACHPDGTVSLWPSISRTRGCRSHFFIEQGRVRWCAEQAVSNR